MLAIGAASRSPALCDCRRVRKDAMCALRMLCVGYMLRARSKCWLLGARRLLEKKKIVHSEVLREDVQMFLSSFLCVWYLAQCVSNTT